MNKTTARKLLIISCSKTKRKLKQGPALEVYDGPLYKILRKYSREDLDVLILSAKYGLIESTKIISPYDTKMTLRLAKEIKVESTYNLLKFIKHNNYYEIFVELGKIYKEGIDFEDLKQKGINFKFDEGTIGIRMHNLKNWLISEKIDVDLPETKKDIN